MAGLYFNISHIPCGHVSSGGACYPGWTKTFTGTCLRYFSTKETFNGAKFACANLMGGKMVTLETKEKITFFKGFLVEQGKSSSLCILMLKV